MNKFQPHIVPVYPPNNEIIFEEWFAENYKECSTDRELLPFFPTSYWVNNNYAQDRVAYEEAVNYIDNLDKTKKYFVPCQYDDGCLIDFKNLRLDVLEFNMSKTNGVMIPLLCQPHPYKFKGGKKWYANFIGGRTHPIRELAERLRNKEGYYISFDSHSIEAYCKMLYESMFTLCFRGYGSSSFRISEAIQQGSIPVYISNEFILPFDLDFEKFGVLIEEKDADKIDKILQAIPLEKIIEKQDRLQEVYEKYYTYEGCMKLIIDRLESEYATT